MLFDVTPRCERVRNGICSGCCIGWFCCWVGSSSRRKVRGANVRGAKWPVVAFLFFGAEKLDNVDAFMHQCNDAPMHGCSGVCRRASWGTAVLLLEYDWREIGVVSHALWPGEMQRSWERDGIGRNLGYCIRAECRDSKIRERCMEQLRT